MPRRRRERAGTALGAYLRDVIDRKFAGNVEEAARATGISRVTLDAWMRGAIADQRVQSLKLAADGLGVPFEDLCRLAVGLPLEPAAARPEPHAVQARATSPARLRIEAKLDAMSEQEARDLDAELDRQLALDQKRLGMGQVRVSRARVADGQG